MESENKEQREKKEKKEAKKAMLREARLDALLYLNQPGISAYTFQGDFMKDRRLSFELGEKEATELKNYLKKCKSEISVENFKEFVKEEVKENGEYRVLNAIELFLFISDTKLSSVDDYLSLIKELVPTGRYQGNPVVVFLENSDFNITVAELGSFIQQLEFDNRDVYKALKCYFCEFRTTVTTEEFIQLINNSFVGIEETKKEKLLFSFLLNPNTNLLIRDMEVLFAQTEFISDPAKKTVVQQVLKNPKNTVSIEEFRHMLGHLNLIGEHSTMQMIESFFQIQKNAVLFTDFIDLLKLLPLAAELEITRIALSFLENPKNTVSFTEFFGWFSSLNFADNYRKIMIAESFLANTNNKLEIREFMKLQVQLNLPTGPDKIGMVKSLLKNPNTKLSIAEFKELKGPLDCSSENDKVGIVESFLKNANSKLSIAEFMELLGLLNLTDDYSKMVIVESFLKNANTNLLFGDFMKLLGQLNLTDDDSKMVIVEYFLKNSQSEVSFENLSEFIRTTGLTFLPPSICRVFDYFSAEKAFDTKAKLLLELSKILYPTSETLQIELFKEAINYGIIDEVNFTYLNFDSMENADSILELLEFAYGKKMLMDEGMTLRLIGHRMSTKFESLRNLFSKNSDLDECFTTEGMQLLNNLFGNNYLIQNNISVITIWSYFDIIKSLFYCSSLLTSDFKVQVANNFHPTSNVLLVQKEELKTVIQLTTGKEEVEDAILKSSDITKRFVPNEVLCDYFLEKVNIPELTDEYIKNYQIKFERKDTARNSPLDTIYLKLESVVERHQKLSSMQKKENRGETLKIELTEQKKILDELKDEVKYVGVSDEELNYSLQKYYEGFSKGISLSEKDVQAIREDLDALITKPISAIQKEEKKEQEAINSSFKVLLNDQNVCPDSTVEFFVRALKINVEDIRSGKSKLADFFRNNKKELAKFLQEGGLAVLDTLLYTHGDGCAKNIGSQFTMALYLHLLNDNSLDLYLYQFVTQKIIVPIVNKGGDIIGAEGNPFKNSGVRGYYLSPDALIQQLARSTFFVDGKINNAWPFLKDKCGVKEEELSELLRLVTEKNEDQMQVIAAEIAAFLMLVNVNNTNFKTCLTQSKKGQEYSVLLENAKKKNDAKTDLNLI
jgi:hypothetical protein